jgi:type II secretion system protein L
MASPNQFGFIHITSHGLVSAESLCSWVIVKAGQLIIEGQGHLPQAIAACAKVPTALALSVHDLIVTKITLPTKSQSQRRTAIPYAVQSQLAAPAKDVHWSWRAKDQTLHLVGIAQPHLTSITSALETLHFAPKWLVADGLHLGGHDAHWQIMALPHSLLVQQDSHSAYCIADDTPLPWLQKAYDEAFNSAAGEPLNMSTHGFIEPALSQWFTDANIDVNSHHTDTAFNSAGILANTFDISTCINLWPQKRRAVWTPNINWPLWRLPYALTVLLGLLGLSYLWLNNLSATQNIEASYQQGQAIFRQTLPNARLVDPLSQLEDQVLALQKPRPAALFLPMLHAFQQRHNELNPTAESSNIVAIKFFDEQLHVTLKTSPSPLDKWPKAGVLGTQFAYKTAPSESDNGAINVTLSIQEAR